MFDEMFGHKILYLHHDRIYEFQSIFKSWFLNIFIAFGIIVLTEYTITYRKVTKLKKRNKKEINIKWSKKNNKYNAFIKILKIAWFLDIEIT